MLGNITNINDIVSNRVSSNKTRIKTCFFHFFESIHISSNRVSSNKTRIKTLSLSLSLSLSLRVIE